MKPSTVPTISAPLLNQTKAQSIRPGRHGPLVCEWPPLGCISGVRQLLAAV